MWNNGRLQDDNQAGEKGLQGPGGKDFKVLEAHTRPYHPDESPLWRLEDMTSPVYFEIKRDETYTFVAYDETSQRLLAYFSSW